MGTQAGRGALDRQGWFDMGGSQLSHHGQWPFKRTREQNFTLPLLSLDRMYLAKTVTGLRT